MNWRMFIEEKWVKMPKSDFSGQKSRIGTGTKKWYWYPRCSGKVVLVPLKLVPVPIGSKGLVPVPVKVLPVPLSEKRTLCLGDNLLV